MMVKLLNLTPLQMLCWIWVFSSMIVTTLVKGIPLRRDGRLYLSDLLPALKVEHNLSLTRSDMLPGTPDSENDHPNPELVRELLNKVRTYQTTQQPQQQGSHVDVELGHPKTEATYLYLDYGSIAAHRQHRYTEEIPRHAAVGDPFTYSPKQHFLADGECAMLLNILGRHGAIPVGWAESFLLHERFPDNWYALPQDYYSMSALLRDAARCEAGYYLGDTCASGLSQQVCKMAGGLYQLGKKVWESGCCRNRSKDMKHEL